MDYESRPGYMNIKEAAARYEVSRAKLHRLIRMGRIQAEKDPRDERASLLKIGDLEEIFRFPSEYATDVADMTSEGDEMNTRANTSGILTADRRARIDQLRMRISEGRRLAQDSTEVIREEREKRSRQLGRATSGAGESGERQK